MDCGIEAASPSTQAIGGVEVGSYVTEQTQAAYVHIPSGSEPSNSCNVPEYYSYTTPDAVSTLVSEFSFSNSTGSHFPVEDCSYFNGLPNSFYSISNSAVSCNYALYNYTTGGNADTVEVAICKNVPPETSFSWEFDTPGGGGSVVAAGYYDFYS